MPSTMSDGVQSKVVADYKEAIYIPIETSGDGEVNVRSRVQMKLYEAKMKSREEFENTLKEQDVTVEQIRDYVAKHPKYRSGMQKVSQHHGISTAANFVSDMAKHV
jgi:predicted nucleotide-binding protein (sugar kinase/HSP70/actin superfamily)